MKIIKKTYDWMGSKVHSKHAVSWYAFLFFIESVFFIPVDPLIILFCLEKRSKSFYYAYVATVASVVGGIFAYFIGAFMWNSVGINLVNWFISEKSFNAAVDKYKLYQNWAVLIGGFFPFPYKAITLSAGFCKLPLIPFIITSFIARGARFYLLAAAIKIWGEQIQILIDKFFNYFVILFGIILALGCWIIIR